MKTERRKVLEMLANGCITTEEAQLLLDTLQELETEAEKKKSDWDFVLDLRGLKTLAQPTPPSISWRPI